MSDERTEAAREAASLLTPRKIAAQVIGFLVGIALLVWCVSAAFRGAGDGWHRILHASPLLVAGLVGCTAVSLAANGACFWLMIQPIRALRLGDMMRLNLVVALLNYAPIRAGLIARVAYHLRVDRLGLLEIGGWIAAQAHVLLLTLGAMTVATLIHPRVDAVWAALLVGQVGFGGLITWALAGQSIVVRFGRGMHLMLGTPASLWGAIVLRLLDLGAFVGRMACAAAILDLSLGVSDTLLLGGAALALSVNPLGRTGFREIAVAFVASRLAAGDLSTAQLDSHMATLALVESAGEALVAIPAGAFALLWFRRRWRSGGATPDP